MSVVIYYPFSPNDQNAKGQLATAISEIEQIESYGPDSSFSSINIDEIYSLKEEADSMKYNDPQGALEIYFDLMEKMYKLCLFSAYNPQQEKLLVKLCNAVLKLDPDNEIATQIIVMNEFGC